MDCELLLRLLPKEYEYKINNIKILARSTILEEQQLKANFVVNICDKDQAEEFVKKFGKVNGSNFRQPRKASRRRGFFGTRFVCCRKVKDQRSSKVADGVGVGQGRRMGAERQKGKGTNCPSQISYKLFKCTNNDRLEDEGCGCCFQMHVKLSYNHNHEVTTCDAWNFLEVEEETKKRYFELFESAFSPSKARLAFIAEMKAELGEEEWFKISAKRSLNPDSRTVFHLYTSFCQRFGSINGPDAYLKAKELIEKINENAEQKIATIRQLEDTTIVVAVVDELMRRTHELVPASADVIFVDATGSVDRCNHQVI